MFNIQNLLAKLLFAACLTGTAGVAAAGPVYHVDIATSSLGTGAAFLDLYFSGPINAGNALATVSNLAGAFGGAPDVTGSVTGTIPGPLVFSNVGGGGELVQAITLGGNFSFDLSFLIDGGTDGMTFGWALFDDDSYLGADGDLGHVFLDPGAAPSQQVSVALDSQLVTVAKIPEPSSVLLMLLAGAAVLLVGRRRC